MFISKQYLINSVLSMHGKGLQKNLSWDQKRLDSPHQSLSVLGISVYHLSPPFINQSFLQRDLQLKVSSLFVEPSPPKAPVEDVTSSRAGQGLVNG